jgi:hypothetical protein
MYYKISYTNILTGDKQSYMNIGFESEKSANDELNRLLHEREKLSFTYTEDVIRDCIKNDIFIPTCIIMSDWKIKSIKLKKL